MLAGDVPETVDGHAKAGVDYDVDLRHGQKTGLFLDQRENRVAAAALRARPAARRFSYNGGFALALAPRCDEVLAVDISEDAVARIRANAARNGVAKSRRAR